MFHSSQSKLLLVESDPLLSDLTSFRLELLGFQIETLNSGSDALSSLSRELPDLLIMGTELRDGDGIELVARLRTKNPPEQLPILICSLDSSLETVERAFAAGAQDYLITPYDPSVLEQKIQDLLQAYRSAVRKNRPNLNAKTGSVR
ncbi:putative transcriptional regulatory protein TcrX [Roseimaritima multifibrata]|uniref:Putative transcriptional regulatory protein TcrX n=1 Tax=Roseimaritima multifibrata TaxID=1930274 RepID=A0A517MDU5_9BACT|nr:response regulator [Roseimaritima multifibrata]QDS93060.1 putative transcriptional regulatory protein TcrX [Roseimaritima multifibrata]